MYRYQSDHLYGMGFSLKPPKWLRNLAATITGGAAKVQTTVDAATAANQPAAPTPGQQINAALGEIPSWVLPVAIASIGAIFLLRKRGR